MLQELSEKIEKADIINFSAIVALIIYVVLVAVSIDFAWRSDTPIEALKDVVLWAMGVVNSIFLAYGITKKAE